MLIKTQRLKTGTLFSVYYDGELVALRSFKGLADAAIVARFLSGADLTGELQERAVALLEGGGQDDD